MDNLDNHLPEVPLNGEIHLTAQAVRPSFKKRIAQARLATDYIPRRGHNSFYNYDYVTAGDVQGQIGKLLAEHGILIRKQNQKVEYGIVRKEGKESNETCCRIEAEYGLADVYSDEVIWYPIAGEGRDTGDKAYYKALTGARKNFLIDALCLPIGDDPEASGDAERETPVSKTVKVLQDKIKNPPAKKEPPAATITREQGEKLDFMFRDIKEASRSTAFGEKMKTDYRFTRLGEILERDYDEIFAAVKQEWLRLKQAKETHEREAGEEG